MKKKGKLIFSSSGKFVGEDDYFSILCWDCGYAIGPNKFKLLQIQIISGAEEKTSFLVLSVLAVINEASEEMKACPWSEIGRAAAF